ncbi:MAG: hypothetical protein HN394_03005 [Rhodospirillaceae bacterium]|jgi:hypothetical protein|nr:hypothetical protein [Rhodospirillaceae bacterium]MBT4699862.1 hypothetical protein [Rhodospirillaceae bacterium]
MDRIFGILTAGCIGVAALMSSGATLAGEQPNILVMGEDADRDTVPRNSRVFKRVLDVLSNAMNDEGFSIYDETAVSLDGFTQGRVRRTDAEIIDIARSIQRPPIDVAVIYAIYASAERLSYTTKIRTRITGRLLNVRSGKRLGGFEVELPQPTNAPAGCNRECILVAAGKGARDLGMDLGAVLAQKLDWLSPSSGGGEGKLGKDRDDGGLASAYSLVFRGFTPDDMLEIEGYIVSFQGYEHHRPVKSSMRSNEYWYESKSKTARLNRNLRLMLDHIGVKGRVVYSGNAFEIDKITRRKTR